MGKKSQWKKFILKDKIADKVLELDNHLKFNTILWRNFVEVYVASDNLLNGTGTMQS